MTKNYYRLHHDFPVMVNGKRKDGPFDWNKIVAQWVNELPPRLREEYPFKEVERYSSLCRTEFLRHRTPNTTISCIGTAPTFGAST